MTLPTDALARRERYLTRFGANMIYLVEFVARAARGLEILYKEKNATESHAAARWYNGLEERYVRSLRFPNAALAEKG
jgi:hypothetical protein